MAWDRTAPVASSALASSPVRSNFQALDYSNFGPNWIRDPYFLIWPAGDSASPAHWLIQGTGATVARETGAGNYLANGMSAKVTRASATAYLAQFLVANGDLPTYFQGKDISLSCWAKCSTASSARISIYDGVSSSFSSYHTGGGGWELLTVARTLGGSADRLQARLLVDVDSTFAYFDLPTMIPGPVPTQGFLPCPVHEGIIAWPLVGDVSTDTDIRRFSSGYPFIVRNVSLLAGTIPVGSAAIVDVNHWDGSAWQSMFSTRPQLAASASAGGADPDGTYRYRCFDGRKNAESQTDSLMNVDIDQVGSTSGPADLVVMVNALQFGDALAGITPFSA